MIVLSLYFWAVYETDRKCLVLDTFATYVGVAYLSRKLTFSMPITDTSN